MPPGKLELMLRLYYMAPPVARTENDLVWLADLEADGLAGRIPRGGGWVITDKGRAFVAAACATPIPTAVWEVNGRLYKADQAYVPGERGES